MKNLILILALLGGFWLTTKAQEIIPLEAPQKQGGMPLMEALNKRQSNRNLSAQEIPHSLLSNLLWAAFGVNRPASNKRTAPSSMNYREIDIYLTTAKGVFLYLPESHSLKKITNQDLRALTGKQDFVAQAAINLVYVANYQRLKDPESPNRLETAHINTGFIAQNVYLFCSSEGLGTVVRAWLEKAPLARALELNPQQQIIVAQSIGYIE